MSKNPLYTRMGLEASEALVLASRMAWTNALADLVVEGAISEDRAVYMNEQVIEDTARLMIGEDIVIDVDGKTVMALSQDNALFNKTANEMADEIDAIAVRIQNKFSATTENEEQSNVTAN